MIFVFVILPFGEHIIHQTNGQKNQIAHRQAQLDTPQQKQRCSHRSVNRAMFFLDLTCVSTFKPQRSINCDSPYIKWNTKAEQQTNLDSLLAKEARMGWQVLNNEHTIIHRGHDSIALVGVENSGNPPFPNYGDLPKALKGTDGIFKVLLSHDPTHWRREVLPESDVQLMLSGHTHEMQFSIFGFSPAKFVYPEHNGLYREGNQALFVNVGLGYLMFPMRLGAWPEITVITLKKE